jgi:acetoin utilization protein AcuB
MGAFLECLGMDDNTKRLIVFVKDKPGYLAGITDLLKKNDINIMGLVTWPEKNHKGIFQMILRTSMEDGNKAVPLLRENGYQVIDGYVEDHTPYIPL